MGRWNAQGLAVFGHGASGTLNALFLQQLAQSVVAERLCGRFVGDQLLQQGEPCCAAGGLSVLA